MKLETRLRRLERQRPGKPLIHVHYQGEDTAPECSRCAGLTPEERARALEDPRAVVITVKYTEGTRDDHK